MYLRPRTHLAALVLALAVGLLAASPAPAAMQSTKIDRNLCETVGGGRFVKIPGFPGEYIDRRLIPDIRWMKRRFDIFITDGYSTDPIHSANGEHPIGLALDIVPYRSRGGNWRKIARLAKRAEPVQNYPRAPFRWVGWNGDYNHGWGHHLHLSYMHSETSFGEPADVVYTRRCPEGRIGRGSRKGGRGARVETVRGVSAAELEARVAPPVPEPRWRSPLDEGAVSQLVFDEDAARGIEAIYQIGDAVRRRRIVRSALAAAPGERILDVGCGPGFYCVCFTATKVG